MKKTPEEILERHTNSEDWTSGLKGDVIDAMQEYATQCQQDNAETFVKFVNEHYSHSSDSYRSELIKSYNAFLTTLNKQ